MIDLIAFYFLAVGVNCFSLNDRISSVDELTNKEKCRVCFEKLFKEIKKLKIKSLDKIALSISLGCSKSKNNYKDFETLYKRSDECLYEAKKLGKGRYYTDSDL